MFDAAIECAKVLDVGFAGRVEGLAARAERGDSQRPDVREALLGTSLGGGFEFRPGHFRQVQQAVAEPEMGRVRQGVLEVAGVEHLDESGRLRWQGLEAASLSVQTLDVGNEAIVPAAFEVGRESQHEPVAAVPKGRHDLGSAALRRTVLGAQLDIGDRRRVLGGIACAELDNDLAWIVDRNSFARLDVLGGQRRSRREGEGNNRNHYF